MLLGLRFKFLFKSFYEGYSSNLLSSQSTGFQIAIPHEILLSFSISLHFIYSKEFRNEYAWQRNSTHLRTAKIIKKLISLGKKKGKKTRNACYYRDIWWRGVNIHNDLLMPDTSSRLKNRESAPKTYIIVITWYCSIQVVGLIST